MYLTQRRPSFRTFLPVLALLLTAAGCGGTSDPTPPVDPGPTPKAAEIVSFSADPAALPAGGSSTTLAWATENAEEVTLTRDGSAIPAEEPLPGSGSIEIRLDATATFELTARGEIGTPATRTLTVEVAPPVDKPVIGTFDAPALVSADASGNARVTLTWTGVIGADELTLEADTLDTLPLASMPDGSIEIDLREDTTLTLVASNSAGEARATAAIRVAALPVIDSFVALPAWVGAADPFEVSWATVGAERIALSISGVNVTDIDPSLTTGSAILAAAADAAIELRATNEAGGEVTETLRITVARPAISAFTGSTARAWLGEVLVLSWETLGGKQVQVATADGETICETQDPAEIAASTCEWQLSTPGVHELTLTVANGSGTATETWIVSAAAGPAISAFTVVPEAISLGAPLTVQWSADSDPSGEEPQLVLTDDRGTTHPLPSGLQGSTEVLLEDAGSYTFTLTATTSNPLSVPAVATATATIFPVPTVALQATPTHFDDTLTDHVTVEWTSTGAETLELFEIGPGMPTLLLSVPEAERAQGSYHHLPIQDATLRLVATNGAMTSVEADALITVAPTEVVRFTATPNEIVPGEPVVLEWTVRNAQQIALDIFDTFVREETTEPFLDLETLGGTHLPLTQCSASVTTHGCELFTFPAGFAFPFGGTDQTTARIFGNGVISFDTGTTPSTSSSNSNFPTITSNSWAHLAVFWDGLGWQQDKYPAGNIWYHMVGDALVIQWKDVGFSGHRTASLNFEVVLHPSGKFEYRYGTMERATANEGFERGRSASIGYQFPDQSAANALNYNTSVQVRDRLENRTFVYVPAPDLTRSGSYVWHPYTNLPSASATLSAIGSETDDATVTVTMLDRPVVDVTLKPDAPIAVGTDFRIGWTSLFATRLELVDPSGAVRCAPAAQVEIDAGFCTLQEAVEGDYAYTLRVSGVHGATFERPVVVRIHARFGIENFEPDSYVTELNGTVNLSWNSTNAAHISLMANGVELLPSSAPSGSGSLVYPDIVEDTTFVLTVTNPLGMQAQETVVVEVATVRLTLTTSATDVRPGTPIDFTFEATSLIGGAPPTVFGSWPMEDVTDTAAPFLTIAGSSTASQLFPNSTSTGRAAVQLPSGFTFPFYGESYDELLVFVDGYVSFNPAAAYMAANKRLPDATTEKEADVHLAPFWDDLHQRTSGTLWAGAPDPDTFIIEWSNFSHSSGSSTSVAYDLNFQVVLHRDGAFEYRYATMEPIPPPATSAGCYPSTCVNEANGSSATIGFQKPGGSSGISMHFGGTTNAAANRPFPGGLANRVLRYQPLVGGSTVTFAPEHSGSYEFCAPSPTGTVCRSVDITAEFGIDGFAATPDVVNFGADATLTWNTTGGTRLVVREDGTEIANITDLAIIDAGTMTATPSKTATYSIELTAGSRSATASRVVGVSRLQLETAASANSAGPGEPVTLSWNMTVSDPDLRPAIMAPMAEIPNAPFTEYDLSLDPTARELHGAGTTSAMTSLVFDPGFTFPFIGKPMGQVQVSSEGFLSFASGATSAAANQDLPNTTYSRVHLAPFWDDLNTRTTGRVFSKQVDPDTYVIQWSHTNLEYGSSDTNLGDLNFQVVLRSNGDFEYRYGQMLAPANPSGATACYPATCVNESNGASATIGYQDRTGTVAQVLHFGGTTRGASQLPMPGGLSNRTWKFTNQTGATGSVVVHPANSTGYSVCAIDPVTEEATCTDPVRVEVDWGILSFEATPMAVVAGDPVSLDWEVAGLDDMVIEVDGVVLSRFSHPVPTTGSINHIPSGSSTYVLRGTSLGRAVSVSRDVEIRTVDLQVTLPAGRYFPGDTATVTWDTTAHEAGDLVVLPPLSEIAAGPGQPGEFIDASTLPGGTEVTMSNTNGFAVLPLPFSFPWFGGSHSQVQIYVDGYLSFDVGTGAGQGANTALPNNGNHQRRVHLAPFWDDLFMRGTDTVWTYQPDPNSFVIQWKNFNRSTGSTASAHYNLNFEVVLYADGSFEYRYGTMDPLLPPAVHSSCYPQTCVNEANGSSATIGYQTFDGLLGYNHHVGGNDEASAQVIPGGLGNRAFRFDPAARGSAQVTVAQTQVIQICATLNGFLECKSVTIEPVADPGDLIITELMIDPTGGSPAQWFEIRNLTDEAIDLDGFTIVSNGGTHDVTTPLVVPAHGFATLAASAAALPAPTYVYGAGLPLHLNLDTLEIQAGTMTIGSATWDVTWFIPAGKTLGLDPSFHEPGIVSHPDVGSWCESNGSPGSIGTGCRYAEYDLDPSSPIRFIDIAATGTRLRELETDSAVAAIPGGFTMPFFDDVVSSVWASANGWVSFSAADPGGATTSSPTVTSVPRTATVPAGPLVAAFWDNLLCDTATQGCAFYYERQFVGSTEVLILQWDGYSRGSSPGSLTVQAQLWANGDIAVAFDDVVSYAAVGTSAWRYYRGSYAWIAIEAADRSYIAAHHRGDRDFQGRTFHFIRK